MKSYVLAIAMAMLVAAGFVYQNPGMVTVRFLMWTRELPQGVWEVVLFAAGGILMWGVSLVAMMEVRNKYRGEIRNLDRRVTELQEERDSLVSALNSIGPAYGEPGEAPSEAVPDALEEGASPFSREEKASSGDTSFWGTEQEETDASAEVQEETPGLSETGDPQDTPFSSEDHETMEPKEKEDQDLF